jgi:hypothetical protein
MTKLGDEEWNVGIDTMVVPDLQPTCCFKDLWYTMAKSLLLWILVTIH